MTRNNRNKNYFKQINATAKYFENKEILYTLNLCTRKQECRNATKQLHF